LKKELDFYEEAITKGIAPLTAMTDVDRKFDSQYKIHAVIIVVSPDQVKNDAHLHRLCEISQRLTKLSRPPFVVISHKDEMNRDEQARVMHRIGILGTDEIFVTSAYRYHYDYNKQRQDPIRTKEIDEVICQVVASVFVAATRDDINSAYQKPKDILVHE